MGGASGGGDGAHYNIRQRRLDMGHIALMCAPFIAVLVGSGGVEIPNSRRRCLIPGNDYGGARHMFGESLGSVNIQTRVEYWNPINSAWEELTPWTPGAGANTLVISDNPQFPSDVEMLDQGDILMRGMMKGNGLVTSTIQFLDIDFRP